eukprot:Sdes_comp20909_c0_seq7m18158
MDSFYRELTREEEKKIDSYNFDHPTAFDFKTIISTVSQMKQGRAVTIPTYDFKNFCRKPEGTVIDQVDVVLFEGILVLYTKELRDFLDLTLFVDIDSDTRLARRVLRDVGKFGRELDYILKQYTRFVKPAFEDYVLPTKKYADVIIPRGSENSVAIGLIVQHILHHFNIQDSQKSDRKSPETIRSSKEIS